MSKAKEYHLNFNVRLSSDRKSPEIICDYNPQIGTVNGDLASFIRDLGTERIDALIREIMDEDPFNRNIIGYEIGGSRDDVLELFSNPPRVVFNTGGEDLIVPLQDFLDIINEWKDYLNSLPFEHTLSNS